MTITDDIRIRRNWFENNLKWVERPTVTGNLVVASEVEGIYFTCPCCGYPTLESRGSHNICYLCRWQDDGQDDHNAIVVLGGPNYELSLIDGRENFESHGIPFLQVVHVLNGTKRETIIISKLQEKIIKIFEQMLTFDNPSDWNLLWGNIEDAKKKLRDEKRNQVRN